MDVDEVVKVRSCVWELKEHAEPGRRDRSKEMDVKFCKEGFRARDEGDGQEIGCWDDYGLPMKYSGSSIRERAECLSS